MISSDSLLVSLVRLVEHLPCNRTSGYVRLSSVRFSDRQHASYARASATNRD